jgi:hypothetical protein
VQAVDFLNDLTARIFSIRYVVELFSFLHDPLKLEEYSDALHGACSLLCGFAQWHFDLKAGQLVKLCHPKQHHNGVGMCKPAPPFSLAGVVTDSIWAGWALGCPFSSSIQVNNIEQYSYHLKHGCRETKTKPIRIYSELADILVFSDGVIFNAG